MFSLESEKETIRRINSVVKQSVLGEERVSRFLDPQTFKGTEGLTVPKALAMLLRVT